MKLVSVVVKPCRLQAEEILQQISYSATYLIYCVYALSSCTEVKAVPALISRVETFPFEKVRSRKTTGNIVQGNGKVLASEEMCHRILSG